MCKENNECVLEDSIISVNVSDELCTNFSLPKKSGYRVFHQDHHPCGR